MLTLGCPGDELIDAIVFASYGLPKGSCATGFTANAACAATNAKTIVAKQCVGKSRCKISATVAEFGGKDPCLGTTKHLSAAIHCASKSSQPPTTVDNNILEAWPCEEQMEKLRLHQAFEIKDGQIHRPPAIGADRCIVPVQLPAVQGSKLSAGRCDSDGRREKAAIFSIVDGHIKHICVRTLHCTGQRYQRGGTVTGEL
eukprot:SAG31_NODE_2008_length_6673_cov_3.990265_6_plen_200_part_00